MTFLTTSSVTLLREEHQISIEKRNHSLLAQKEALLSSHLSMTSGTSSPVLSSSWKIDNVVILVSAIQHLLDQSCDTAKTLGIITYIDFTTAFDSVLHSYLLKALKEYGIPLKYCRLVQVIYESDKVRVRLQEINGQKSYSCPISIKRGFIQGDIPSAICFIIALDKLLKDHGNLRFGIQLYITNAQVIRY